VEREQPRDRKAERKAQSEQDKAFHTENRMWNRAHWFLGIRLPFLRGERKPIQKNKNYQIYRPPRGK